MANRMIHTPSYLTTATHAEYWTSSSGSMTVVSGFYVGVGGTATLSKTFDSQSGWTVGAKVVYTSSSTTHIVFAFLDTTTAHCELRFNMATGLFTVTRNGTLIQTGTTVLTQNVEYYIEWQVVIADTGTSILVVDGVTDSGINSTSVDTRNAANATANVFNVYGTNVNPTMRVKDLYLNDNNTANDATFWGPIAVATLTPSGAGNKAQWTPLSSTNVSNVDDATVDGDSTYNSTATNGQIDSFVATDTGYASGTVKGVEWAAEVRRTDASGTARVAPLFRIGSTDYAGTDIAFSTSYQILSQRYRQSPATTAAWTVSELDAAEIGYKRSAA